jgi:prephenate dehydratase
MSTDNIIAFQGVPGAYADLACRSVYPAMDTLSCPSFEECFIAVRESRARYAMIPVENSIAGRVADIHHLLPEGGLSIIGEHYQRVLHHFLVTPGSKIEQIKTAKSHIQALMQCRKFLSSRGIKPVGTGDTAGGAKSVAEMGDPTVAAIASSLAGEIYGLESVAADIADMPDNTTRFLILSREGIRPPVGDFCITSLLFRTRSVPAALYKALGGFATCGVNLTKIESYLVGGKFDAAQFYVDVEGHPDERPLQMALEELRFYASELRILGTYPAHPFRRRGQT